MTLGIYGSGGAGRSAKDIADLIGNWPEIVFIDDTVEPGIFKGIPRMPFSQFIEIYPCDKAEIIIAMGEPEHKIQIYNKVKSYGYSFANLIHPNAQISPSAQIGSGIIVQIGSMVSCDAVIEDNVTLEEYVVAAHDVIIRSHAQISAFVMLAGHVEVGSGTYIGIGVPVKEETIIGANSIIGMGSVVTRNIPDNVIALGNPARAMQIKNDDKVFK